MRGLPSVSSGEIEDGNTDLHGRPLESLDRMNADVFDLLNVRNIYSVFLIVDVCTHVRVKYWVNSERSVF